MTLSYEECPNRLFASLTEEYIYNHLAGKDGFGRDVVGVYPIMYDNTCFYVLTLMTRVVNTVIKTMYLHLFVFAKNGKSLVTSNALVRATEHMFGFSLKHLLQIEQTIFHAQIVVDNEAVQKETAGNLPT